MGQSYSGQPIAPSPVSKPPSLRNAPSSSGFKLKRVFGSRKYSEDVSSPSSSILLKGRGRDQEQYDVFETHSQTSPVSSRPPVGAKQRTLSLASQVFSSKKPAPPPMSPRSPGLPPPPPPKPSGWRMAGNHVDGSRIHESLPEWRSPVLANAALSPVSPSTHSAEVQGQQGLIEDLTAQKMLTTHYEIEPGEETDDWRKSDSTVGQHNIRPNANVDAQVPRPVSTADSLQSNHTIVPANKRLSALVTDVEFVMTEEGDSDVGFMSITSASRRNTSPTPSLQSSNCRSLSLNIPPPTPPKEKTTGSSDSPVSSSESGLKPSLSNPSYSLPSDGISLSPTAKETPILTKTASGLITPSTSDTASQTSGNHVRGRLAAWTDATVSSSRPLPAIPTAHQGRPSVTPGSPGFRKATLSITSSFAPAAGLAKRAVEKMGRAWGGLGSNSNSSGYSSSSSTRTTPSTFSSASDDDYSSVTMSVKIPKDKGRRTPNSPSAAWSVTSCNTSSSVGDPDASSISAGPNLGKCLRDPLRLRSGDAPVASGILFKRDLMTAVRMTSVDPSSISTVPFIEGTDLKALEARKLPALVVRCAQHLFIWGIHEEGLFRSVCHLCTD
jgi:hypothetical protein